jgi:hypothetical protein
MTKGGQSAAPDRQLHLFDGQERRLGPDLDGAALDGARRRPFAIRQSAANNGPRSVALALFELGA